MPEFNDVLRTFVRVDTLGRTLIEKELQVFPHFGAYSPHTPIFVMEIMEIGNYAC